MRSTDQVARPRTGAGTGRRPHLWRFLLWSGTTWLALSAVGPTLRLDAVWPGMAFTYTPRVILASLALPLGAALLLRRRRWPGLVNLAAGALLLADAGLGAELRVEHPPCPSGAYNLLSLNTEDSYLEAPRLAALCRELGIDILCLQEVSSEHRDAFIAALGEYRLFWSRDEEPETPYGDPRRRVPTCLTGIRADRLGAGAKVQLAAGLTGYRTHGVHVELEEGGSLWIVNVHTTKPIYAEGSWWRFLARARWKVLWHREEHDLLAAWLARHRDEAVVIAGDFNAPSHSYNTRFEGFRNAHWAAGSGWHATFPRTLPLLGIDNVLGNNRVAFLWHAAIDPGFGDHRGQVFFFGPVGR